jgi:hypothetical protein
MPQNNQITNGGAMNSRWKDLYKIGGAAALIAAVLLPLEIIIFTVWPLPNTVMGYFTLFKSNNLIGLIDFYLLEVVAYALFIPMFLAIYFALKRFNESYMVIATILAIIGITVFFATNNPFSILSLSNQYAAATTEAQKSMILVAGQAILVNTGQRAVGGFNMGFFFLSVAGLLVSAVMLRSNIFSKATANVGILAFAISLADYFRIIFVPSAIILTLIIAITSALFLIIWLILVGLRLFQLGNGVLDRRF